MPTKENLTKGRLKAGQIVLGFGVNLLKGSSPGFMAAATGYDFLFIDMEHGSMTIDDASQTAVAALGQGVTPIVRCCQTAIAEGTRLMDNGAMGIVIPHIETAEQAREVVSTFLFSPQGHRGLVRLAHFGYVKPDFARMMAEVNEETLITVMIENAKGVANADEIAAVPGVDVLMFGTSDLSDDLGVIGQTRHPKIRAAYETVAQACKRHGKTLGMAGVFDPEAIKDYIGLGARMILVNTDAGFINIAAAEQSKIVRSLA
jgi:2-keto-3-deoxy-L-rhamnonate aldolase RhmA